LAGHGTLWKPLLNSRTDPATIWPQPQCAQPEKTSPEHTQAVAQPEHARPEHTKPRFTGPQFTGTNPASLRCGTYDNGDNIDLAGKLINEDKELFGAQLEKFKRKPHILGMKIRGLQNLYKNYENGMAVIRQIEKEFKVYHRPSLKSMTLLLERYQRYLRKLEEVDEDLLLAYYSMPIAFRKEKRIIIEKLESFLETTSENGPGRKTWLR
ncbi:MAG: hypothetical protein L6R41_008319, partial [Letrouitia leprolyta]